MKREWIIRINDILTICMNHLILMVFAMTVLDLFTIESPKLLLWSSMIGIAFFFDYVRIKAKTHAMFYIMHFAAFLGICLCTAEQITKAMMVVIALGYAVYSVYLKMFSKSGKQELIPVGFGIVLFGIFELIEKIKSENDWSVYYLILALVYLCVYFISYFINHYIQFLSMNERTAANIPEKEIYTGGMKSTVLFSVGSLVVLLLTANLDWLTKMIVAFLIWLRDILRKLISGMEPVPEEMSTEMVPQIEIEMGEYYEEALLPDFLLELIQWICLFLTALLVIGMIVLSIVFIYKFVKGNFKLFKDKKKEEELLSNGDVRENCGFEKSTKIRDKWYAFLNHREKIRKLFRKRILKSKRILIGEREEKQLEYLTAKECCDRLSEQNLKEVYEKARYSKEEITSEDIRRLKNNSHRTT